MYFYHLRRMNYYKAVKRPGVIDDICINSEQGEVVIEWTAVNNTYSPRLTAFDDSWETLNLISDLIPNLAELAKQNKATAKNISQLLIDNGIEDRSDKPLEA